jgi:hypothetical protein
MLKRLSTLVSLVFFVLTGCNSTPPAPSSNLRQVDIGMSEATVLAVMGEPRSVRGSIRNKFDQIIEVWEYQLALPIEDSSAEIAGKSAATVLSLGMGAATFAPEERTYWLYFSDGVLARWGEAGDWEKEPERIYRFNFDPSPRLKQ